MRDFVTVALAGALLTGAGLVALAEPAHATGYCQIRPTADGFVALRTEPRAEAQLVVRMTAAGEVLLGQERRGKWVRVSYWRGGRFASGKNPAGDPPTAEGWMNGDFIVKDSCG